MLGQIVGLDAPEGALPTPVRSLASVSHLMSLAGLGLPEHFATVLTLVPGRLVNIFVGVPSLGGFAHVITIWVWTRKVSVIGVVHCVMNVLFCLR